MLLPVTDIVRRFRVRNPGLMLLPPNHEPKHGLGHNGRPRSLDRLRLEKMQRELIIATYKKEGLVYCARQFNVSRWSLIRTLKIWNVTLNNGFTKNSLQRFSEAMIIIHRTRTRDIAQELVSPSRQVWPYISNDPGPEHHLVLAVNEAVPKGLRESIRADVCQDLLVAILDNQIEMDDLPQAVPEFIKRQIRLFPTKYGPMSLEKPVYDDDLILLDTLHEGNIRYKW